MSAERLLGLRFDQVTVEEALERIESLSVEARRNCLPARMVVTVNVQILVTARHHCRALIPIINEAPLVVADGMPLVLLSRIFGPRLPERVAGSDLIYGIIKIAEHRGLRVFFLGGEEEHTRKAVESLLALHPDLQVAGVASPRVERFPQGDQLADEEKLCRNISESGTDILLVCFGCPKQELFINRNAERLKGMVAIGLGGTLNFVSGKITRAPHWMRRLALEWLHRVIQEPRRLFMRYFTDAFFLAYYIVIEAFKRLLHAGRQ